MKIAAVMVAGLVAAMTVACTSAPSEDVATGEGAASAGSNLHTPQPGSAERTAFFEGLRREFDRQVESNPAVGTKDVEFDVSGNGIFRVATRNGVTWGFMAGDAVKPGTREPFDFSKAPESVKYSAMDEEGNVNNHVIAIMKMNPNGSWDIANVRGYPELYFAPGDVAWVDLPCTSGLPFGLLEGAAASQAECSSSAKCEETENSLTKVPAANLGDVIRDFTELDGAAQVTTTPDGPGTFTVTARVTVCK
jgi:hypothetical protein